MQVDNFTETVHFMAQSLLSPGIVSPEVAQNMRKFAMGTYASKEEKDKAFEELVATFPDVLKKELESLNVRAPGDVVEVKMDFGAFLYDLYVGGSTAPSAPLAQMAHQSRLQKLSERLDAKKLDLKPEELSVIKKTLENDDRWSAVVFHAYTSKEKQVPLNCTGITYFTKIVEEAVKLFGDQNETKAAVQSADNSESTGIQVG